MKAIVGRRPSVYGISGLTEYADSASQDVTALEANAIFGNAGSGVDGGGLDAVNGIFGGSPLNTTNETTNTNPLSAIAALTNSFTSIFRAIQPVPAGCTSVAGPYGQSLQCAGAGNAGTSLGLPASIGGISSSTILLLGGVVVVFILMKK